MEKNLNKPALYEVEENLEKGCIIFFQDGTLRVVKKFKKLNHRVVFENDEEKDLYSIYDNISNVLFLDEAKLVAVTRIVYDSIKSISSLCRYHIYPEVIFAFLVGDANHYISEFCNSDKLFGSCPNVEMEQILTSLNYLKESRFIKENKKGNKKIYYTIRKDGKLYPDKK